MPSQGLHLVGSHGKPCREIPESQSRSASKATAPAPAPASLARLQAPSAPWRIETSDGLGLCTGSEYGQVRVGALPVSRGAAMAASRCRCNFVVGDTSGSRNKKGFLTRSHGAGIRRNGRGRFQKCDPQARLRSRRQDAKGKTGIGHRGLNEPFNSAGAPLDLGAILRDHEKWAHRCHEAEIAKYQS